jgi:hypothetical protein
MSVEGRSFGAEVADMRDELGRLRAALEYLADRANWMGSVHSQESTLHGHDTPFELAERVLREVGS